MTTVGITDKYDLGRIKWKEVRMWQMGERNIGIIHELNNGSHKRGWATRNMRMQYTDLYIFIKNSALEKHTSASPHGKARRVRQGAPHLECALPVSTKEPSLQRWSSLVCILSQCSSQWTHGQVDDAILRAYSMSDVYRNVMIFSANLTVRKRQVKRLKS